MGPKEYFPKEKYPPYLYSASHATSGTAGPSTGSYSGGKEEKQQQQQGSENITIGSPTGLMRSTSSAVLSSVSSAVLLLNLTSPAADGGSKSKVGGLLASRRRSLLGFSEPIAEEDSATPLPSLRVCASSPNMLTSTITAGQPTPAAATGSGSMALTPTVISSQLPQLAPDAMYEFLQTPFPPSWRLKERMKTVGICLVLALNIGTDPPDVHKPTPCAKLQTWFDPTTISRSKARERIAERLESQYAKWQQRTKLKCKSALDPTIEEVRALCLSMRRNAKNERVLLHYNGHGVPRCTANGEIWLFDKNHTQYIPLSVLELKKWLGKPSVIVLDCSNAGVLVPFFVSNSGAGEGEGEGDSGDARRMSSSTVGGGDGLEDGGMGDDQQQTYPSSAAAAAAEEDDPYSSWAANAVREYIVLAPCAEGQSLSMNPDYPADVFTSCLTTPIPIALRWFIRKNPLSMEGVDPEVVDRIPGKLNDRKTPLGELNWIFTAITDTIAWNVLPSPLFQRLFRQDLLVASLFRNFLLADRILRSFKCTPVSYPALPPTWNHPLWEAWDLSVETCLYQLLRQGHLGPTPAWGIPNMSGIVTGSVVATGLDIPSLEEDGAEGGNNTALSSSGPPLTPTPPPQTLTDDLSTTTVNVTSPFFSEQLTAFELWVEFAACRYGDSYGIPKTSRDGVADRTQDPMKSLDDEALEMKPPEQLPVVLQVLLSQTHRVRALVLLRKFLHLGPYAVNLALSVGIFPYVLKLLQSPIDEYKHVLVGIWAKILAFDPSCQVDLVKDGALPHFVNHLYWGLNSTGSDRKDSSEATEICASKIGNQQDAAEQRTMAAYILSSICFNYPTGQTECLRQNLHIACSDLLRMAEKDFDDDDNEEFPMDFSAFKKEDEQFTTIFKLWLCICLGNLCNENVAAQAEAYAKDVHFRLFACLRDDSPLVRSAAALSLGVLIGRCGPNTFALRTPVSPARRNTNGAGVMNFSRSPNAFQVSTPPDAISSHIDRTNSTDGMHLSFQQTPTNSQNRNFDISDGESFSMGRGVFEELESESSCLSPEDRSRLSLDLAVAKKLMVTTSDASPVVRYETILALGCCVEKYLPAFAEMANDNTPVFSDTCDDEKKTTQGETCRPSLFHSQLSAEIGSENAKDIRLIWAVLRDLQHKDPFPAVSDTANTVVSVVHEYVLMANVSPDDSEEGIVKSRIQSMEHFPHAPPRNLGQPTVTLGKGSVDSALSSPIKLPLDAFESKLRRQVSDQGGISALYRSIPGPHASIHVTENKFRDDLGSLRYRSQYKLPRSQYNLWLRSRFGRKQGSTNFHDQYDPENPHVATCLYTERRNALVHKHSLALAERFEILSRESADSSKQKSVTFTSFSVPNDDVLFTDLEREEASAVAAALEAEISSKKKALQMKQSTLLHNEGSAMSTMLSFHPYEPALIVCDGSDIISLWDINKAKKSCSFHNGNDKGSRMTSISWVNEESNSLLVTGASDGTSRVWQGLVRDDGSLSDEKPTLVSAFLAEPDIVAGKRGSGLVMEWQQCTGQLVTAGSSSVFRCWDVETEKCCNVFDRNSEACVTTISSAWDSLVLGNEEKFFSGIGPSIVVAGYGDGSIRVFDTRFNHGLPASTVNGARGNGFGAKRKRGRLMQYHEHSSWIVNTCFTGFGAKYEILSGCVAGDIKFWDLRLSSSTRTLDIQRSPMTAFAGHTRIPMLATGSHDQFIKIVTSDGDTLNVKRFHEVFHGSGQRIGPVSCLTFHPNMLLLAAGFTDEFVSIYSPKVH